MSDKRQEFVERMENETGMPEQTIRDILEEYDKLKSDKWERLKEFIEKEIRGFSSISMMSFITSEKKEQDSGSETEARKILAEIERLGAKEKE